MFDIYEKAIEQKTNLAKSICMVNKNVDRSKAEDLSKLLGIKLTNSIGHYLRLPTQMGRNKMAMFKRLKERVWKVLQGWKGSLFSLGGKRF